MRVINELTTDESKLTKLSVGIPATNQADSGVRYNEEQRTKSVELLIANTNSSCRVVK